MFRLLEARLIAFGMGDDRCVKIKIDTRFSKEKSVCNDLPFKYVIPVDKW